MTRPASTEHVSFADSPDFPPLPFRFRFFLITLLPLAPFLLASFSGAYLERRYHSDPTPVCDRSLFSFLLLRVLTSSSMARRLLLPGPEAPSVLTEQHSHISNATWNQEEDRLLRVRCHLNISKPDERVMHYVRMAKFGGVAEVGRIILDYHLISALVERWRPETHTFHMPPGECTITLQDVEVMLGLPVDGDALIDSTSFNWEDLCDRLLGEVPPPSKLDGGRVKLTWLSERFGNLPENASDTIVQQHARAYILRLIGGWLLPDNTGKGVHLIYLPLLENFESAGKLSWGSALLAYLYRQLCKATNRDYTNLGGCSILLQVWAWERFRPIAPKRQHEIQINGPLVTRWNVGLNFSNVPLHNQKGYRAIFDQLELYEIVWHPYSDEVMAMLPAYCSKGRQIWTAQVSLICFCIVEAHNPDRVMRQFGGTQHIPRQACYDKQLHLVNFKGRTDNSWPTYHRKYIEIWDSRSTHVVSVQPCNDFLGPDSEYMHWYQRITRKWMSPKNARVNFGISNQASVSVPEGQVPSQLWAPEGQQQRQLTIEDYRSMMNDLAKVFDRYGFRLYQYGQPQQAHPSPAATPIVDVGTGESEGESEPSRRRRLRSAPLGSAPPPRKSRRAADK